MDAGWGKKAHPTRSQLLRALRTAFPSYPDAFDPEDYLHAEGEASQALLCVDLFFPTLEEVSGSIFLAQNVAEPSQRERAAGLIAQGERREVVERSFNRQELPHAFHRGLLAPSAETVLAVAVARSWRLWLSSRYPVREFEVAVLPPQPPDVTTVVFTERHD